MLPVTAAAEPKLLPFPFLRTQSRSRVGPSLQGQEEASVFGGWRMRERKAEGAQPWFLG